MNIAFNIVISSEDTDEFLIELSRINDLRNYVVLQEGQVSLTIDSWH